MFPSVGKDDLGRETLRIHKCVCMRIAPWGRLPAEAVCQGDQQVTFRKHETGHTVPQKLSRVHGHTCSEVSRQWWKHQAGLYWLSPFPRKPKELL